MVRLKIIISYTITLVLFFTSCDNIFGTKNTKLAANAGSDQTTIVGSYAILDAGKSSGDIDWYEWEQDEKNPERVKIFSGNENFRQQIGFVKEGIYKFKLTVKSGTQSSKADEAMVTVNPNPQYVFEDPNLEIAVRFMLKEQTEILTDDILLTLDSLRYFDVVEDILSLKGLEHCKNLTCLQMGHQSISDISPVATLIKLRVLDLTQNRKISDITPLTELTQLEWLDLDSNLITDILPLTNLVNLKYLNLMYNDIMDISPIANATKLKEIRMADASLNDISALINMRNLELLWFSRCDVNEISCLQNLTNIKTLKLTWNHFENISSLSNLKKLEWVALEQNRISNLSPLKDLTNLNYVRLWDNQITDIKPLVDNTGIGKGDIIGLNGNPLEEISINEYIPALQARGVVVTWK